jgi:hypothetical protein
MLEVLQGAGRICLVFDGAGCIYFVELGNLMCFLLLYIFIYYSILFIMLMEALLSRYLAIEHPD